MDATNEQQRITGNRVFDSIDGSSTGIQIASANGAVVDNNSVFNMYLWNGH